MPDGLLGVVGASFDLGALQETLNERLGVDGQRQHGVELVTALGEVVVQRADLVQGAGEAVQQEAGLRIVLIQPVGDDLLGEFVRNIITGRHDRFHLEAQWGLLLHVRTEDVSGRNRRNAVVGSDAWGLGAFTCARSPHNDQSHLRNPS